MVTQYYKNHTPVTGGVRETKGKTRGGLHSAAFRTFSPHWLPTMPPGLPASQDCPKAQIKENTHTGRSWDSPYICHSLLRVQFPPAWRETPPSHDRTLTWLILCRDVGFYREASDVRLHTSLGAVAGFLPLCGGHCSPKLGLSRDGMKEGTG